MTSKSPTIGETSLTTLLSSLKVTLHPDTFVWLTIPPSALPPPPSLYRHMTFREAEGLTIITTKDSAHSDKMREYTFPCRMITCEVHSSLEAVGFMAVITKRLTALGLGVNPVSGYFHDHLFVPEGREEEVVRALEELAAEARGQRVRE